MSEKQFFEAIDRVDAMASTAAVGKEDLCKIYKAVKPILEGILPFIELIPGWGKKAAAAIRLLMKGLDALCP
jgi:hypothetical protein